MSHTNISFAYNSGTSQHNHCLTQPPACLRVTTHAPCMRTPTTCPAHLQPLPFASLCLCHLLDGTCIHSRQPRLFSFHLCLCDRLDGAHVAPLILCKPARQPRVMEGIAVVGCIHDALLVLATQHALGKGQHLGLPLQAKQAAAQQTEYSETLDASLSRP